MKLKLALFSVIVPCLSVLIASTLAQSPGSQGSGSSGSSGGPAYGQGSVSEYTGLRTGSDDLARDPFAQSSPAPHPVREGQTSNLFSRPATFYGGNIHDWRVHNNEEAAIAILVQRLKDAKSDSEIEKLKGQLEEALEKSFAMRQKRHTQEIEELEAKVKTLKELVAKRQEKRREIVANRREQILRDAQGLGW
jgi:hypothetical protein